MKVCFGFVARDQITWFQVCKYFDVTKADLWDETRQFFKDVSQYSRLIGKLIYIIVTRKKNCFLCGVILIILCISPERFIGRQL